MKKINVFILVFIIVCIIFVIAFLANRKPNNNNGENKTKTIIVPDLERKYSVEDVCIDDDSNCLYKESKYYRIDDYNKNPDLASIIENINNVNINRFEDIKGSKYSFDECPDKAQIYKYRYVDNGQIHFYGNDNIVVIAQDLVATDVCTDKVTTPSFNTYYYDVNSQKVINDDEFLNLLKIKKNKVEEKIIAQLLDKKLIKSEKDYHNKSSSKQLKCHIYLSMVGNMLARCIFADESFDEIALYKKMEMNL